MTTAHALTWAGLFGYSIAVITLSARSLRAGLPKIRQSQARLTEARAHARDVQAHLLATRQELESWLAQHPPPAGGNSDHPREHAR